jgi:hypothetical protein
MVRWSLRNFPVIAWLLAVACYLRAGFIADGYAMGHGIEVAAYPVGSVLLFSLVSAVECLVLWLVVRPSSFRRSWGRLLAALGLFIPWLIVSLLGLMHAPPVHAAHAYWLLLMVAGLAVATVIVGLRRDMR